MSATPAKQRFNGHDVEPEVILPQLSKWFGKRSDRATFCAAYRKYYGAPAICNAWRALRMRIRSDLHALEEDNRLPYYVQYVYFMMYLSNETERRSA